MWSMKLNNTITFKCANCGHSVTEEEPDIMAAQAMAERDFSEHPNDGEFAMVCQPCYDKIVALVGNRKILQ